MVNLLAVLAYAMHVQGYRACKFCGIAHRPCRGVFVLQTLSTNMPAYRSILPFGDTVSMSQLHLCFRSISTRHLIPEHIRIPY